MPRWRILEATTLRGQNGFQLSLQGFDPQFDYDALTKESRGRRVAGTSVQQIERTDKTVGRRHKKLAGLADKVHGNSQNIE